MHHTLPHLGLFFVVFAIIRHPVAGIAALIVSWVVGRFLYRRRK